MPVNNFKPFAIASGSNVTSQTEWEGLIALSTGFTAGLARADQINKALRQGTVMASVLAQFMAETTGEDVLDDGDTAKLVSLITMSVNSVARSALPVGTPSLGPQIVYPQRETSHLCRGKHLVRRHIRYWLLRTRQV